MNCPSCLDNTRVVESRPTNDNKIRRRRECLTCGLRMTTEEKINIPKKKELDSEHNVR